MAAIQPQGISSANEQLTDGKHGSPKAITVAILGGRGSGKTTWMQRFIDSKGYDNVMPGSVSYPIDFKSNFGPMRCNALDIPFWLEQIKLDTICYGVDGIIFMLDLQSSDPFQDISLKHAHIMSLNNIGDKPMLLCGNKVDVPADRRVHARDAAKFAKDENFNNYYEMSTLANRNITEPFAFVAKLVEYRRTGRHLEMITSPRLFPPQRAIDHHQELIENERIIAAIITPAVNVVQEQFHDHSSSTQRDFIQSKRERMGSFVGVDDESDEDENIV